MRGRGEKGRTIDEERLGRIDLFYESLDALISYANECLHVSGAQGLSMRSPDKRLLDETSRVLDALWEHRELVDSFVAENPWELDERHLETIRPWRHALTGTYVCVDAQPDSALYLGGGRVFAVRPLVSPADGGIRTTPCLVALTLLPFDGEVVTDGRIRHLSDTMSPNGAALLAGQLAAATARGVIATDAELVAYERALRDHRIASGDGRDAGADPRSSAKLPARSPGTG